MAIPGYPVIDYLIMQRTGRGQAWQSAGLRQFWRQPIVGDYVELDPPNVWFRVVLVRHVKTMSGPSVVLYADQVSEPPELRPIPE